jgi:spore coat polysaccharide biosynthesis protein SpsF
LYTEGVTLKALKNIYSLTDEIRYYEHVTNFIYENPNIFNIYWLKLPEFLIKRKDIRFTLDTNQDFKLYQKLFLNFDKSFLRNYKKLISYIDTQEEILYEMHMQIKQNSK